MVKKNENQMIKDVNGSWANWILDQCMILVNVAEQT